MSKRTHYFNKRRELKTQIKNRAAFCERFIKNLSDKKLTDQEIIVLGRGLKYIPTPVKPNKIMLLSSVKELERKMRMRYFMFNKNTNKVKTFKLPSKWVPRPAPCQELENYFDAVRESVAKLKIKNQKQNLTFLERKALISLKNDKSIVIKPFDKGRGIAILNPKDYKNEIMRQLKSAHYTRIDTDITHETKVMVRDTVKDMAAKEEIDSDTMKYLNPDNYNVRTPLIYVLPKLHKPPPPNTKFAGRPIISGCGSPTERISEFVDYFLIPIVKKQKTYLKDTMELIKKLENLVLEPNILLATMDVTSMYTNIVQDEAITAVCAAFEKAPHTLYDIPKISVETMCTLLKLILKRNCSIHRKQFVPYNLYAPILRGNMNTQTTVF